MCSSVPIPHICGGLFDFPIMIVLSHQHTIQQSFPSLHSEPFSINCSHTIPLNSFPQMGWARHCDAGSAMVEVAWRSVVWLVVL